MLGYIPYNWTEQDPYGATIMIDSIKNFGFPVPFTENDRHILFTNSSNYIEDWLSDWMYNNPQSLELRMQNRESEIPVPQPMMNQRTIAFFNSPDYPYINSFNLFDSTDPGMIQAPTNMDSIKMFLFKLAVEEYFVFPAF